MNKDEYKELKNINKIEMLNVEGAWSFEENIYNAFENADAVVVLTEWHEYSLIDWEIASKKVRKPCFIFDSRSILVKEDIIKNDLNFWRVGDGNYP